MRRPSGKPLLYARTVSHLRPSQVLFRAWRSVGGSTPIRPGYAPNPDPGRVDIARVPALPELDFDPTFLSRFDVDALVDDRVSLLCHEERVDWHSSWHEELSTPLWRFNLHYHEYLLPLAKAYLDTGNPRYLDKAKEIVRSWVRSCPESRGGAAWDPYVISMRVVAWLALRAELRDALEADPVFYRMMDGSLAAQYVSLSQHLEADLLANHYLEDLKALTLLACYFADWETLSFVLPLLRGQVAEQILPDGTHFELSPMYHKVVFEDLMRVATTLRACGLKGNLVGDYRLREMADALWTIESGCDRTPLFNDAGDNVAKSRDALLACAGNHFGIEPSSKGMLLDAGYVTLERDTVAGHVKLVLDCGQPGPLYAMGHTHCDALSMECFVDGRPWVVNLGTYAYQGETRLIYKSSASHSASVVIGHEQHECWAPFRVARHGSCEPIRSDGESAEAMLTTYDGTRVSRSVRLTDDGIAIHDACDDVSCELVTTMHFAYANPFPDRAREPPVPYAPGFGFTAPCSTVRLSGRGSNSITIPYPNREEGDS